MVGPVLRFLEAGGAMGGSVGATKGGEGVSHLVGRWMGRDER